MSPPKSPQRWHMVEIEGKPIMFDTEQEAQAFIKRNRLFQARPFFIEKSYDWIIKLWR